MKTTPAKAPLNMDSALAVLVCLDMVCVLTANADSKWYETFDRLRQMMIECLPNSITGSVTLDLSTEAHTALLGKCGKVVHALGVASTADIVELLENMPTSGTEH